MAPRRLRRRRGEEVGERGGDVPRVCGVVALGAPPRGLWRWALAGRGGAARGEERREDLRCGRGGVKGCEVEWAMRGSGSPR